MPLHTAAELKHCHLKLKQADLVQLQNHHWKMEVVLMFLTLAASKSSYIQITYIKKFNSMTHITRMQLKSPVSLSHSRRTGHLDKDNKGQ